MKIILPILIYCAVTITIAINPPDTLVYDTLLVFKRGNGKMVTDTIIRPRKCSVQAQEMTYKLEQIRNKLDAMTKEEIQQLINK